MLTPQSGETLVDLTAGLGGHAALVAERLGPRGRVILNDADARNLERASDRVAEAGVTPIPIHGNFAEIPRVLQQRGIAADMALADLGFASNQVDDPARGLSFREEGPLDMRLDPWAPGTAASLLETLSEAELASIIRDYGEERFAGRIARAILRAREDAPIESTSRLAEIVRSAVPSPRRARGTQRRRTRPIDPATRTFQALRIAVNDEIGSLERLLDAIEDAAARLAAGERDTWLAPGARVAIIAFHSLEDRPVKHRFAQMAERGWAERLTRKPLRASDEEIERNRRARSAKLRAIRLQGSAGPVERTD